VNETNLLEDQPIAWTPTPEVIECARLTQFMQQVGVSTWDELYKFSIEDVEKFTEEVIRFLDIKFDPPYENLLDTSNGVEFPVWFGTRTSLSASPKTPEPHADKDVRVPAGLNITEMCLDRWQTDEMKDRPAVIWEGEEGDSETLGGEIQIPKFGTEYTYGELFEEVRECTEGLRLYGFKKGDAIGLHLPMMMETVVALLAINRIGGIAVPVFSGYGVEAIASRMNAVEAKALFTCDYFPRRGKKFDALSVAIQAVEHIPTIEKVFVIYRDHRDLVINDPRIVDYVNLIEKCFDEPKENFDAEPTSAEDPLIILYTSGTTGKPKGIAHTHASFPIKAAQDMAFGTDVGKGTRISWYTDIGWMMGPWLIYGALINGATICIYDGAPDYPTPDRMWEFCAKHKVEVLGISPTLVRSLAASEDRSADTLVRMDAASAFKESVEIISSLIEQDVEPSDTPSLAGGTGDADKSVRAPFERRGWYRHKLPHYDGSVTQFITFRLADSMPQSVLEKIRHRIEHDKLTEFSEEFRSRVEDYLDSGSGECILRDPAVARVVENTILNEHKNSCDVTAWVVMPNHAHILLRPIEGHFVAEKIKRH